MDKIIGYLREVQSEMVNVTWPTRSQTTYFTVGVLAVSVFIAYYLGFLDMIFTRALEWALTFTR